jgi:hypothetical protein
VNFYTSYSTCGNGGSGYTVTNNAWVIESYYDKAVGSSMAVCALQGTPSGWATQYYFTTSSQCPYTSTVTNNVKVILRLH